MRSSNPSAALHEYEKAIELLFAFDGHDWAAWPLALCLANHAQAALELERYSDALDDCDDGMMLIGRYRDVFDSDKRDELERKLVYRKERAEIAMAEEAPQPQQEVSLEEQVAEEPAAAEEQAADNIMIIAPLGGVGTGN